MNQCLAGERCRQYDRTLQQAAPVEDFLPLCDLCLSRAQHAVPLLVHDWRDLEQLIPPALGQWGDGQPGHSGEAPIPIHTGVEALQQDIWRVTTTWAGVLADEQRLATPPWRRPGPVVRIFVVSAGGGVEAVDRPARLEHPSAWETRRLRPGPADVAWAVRILGPRVETLARLGEAQLVDYPFADPEESTRYRNMVLSTVSGAQGVLDLARLHDRARRMLGLTRDTRNLPGYCQTKGCGRPGLVQENGSDTVWCTWCGAAQTRDDYEQYGNVFLRPMNAA